jgi:hypothetical protein
VNYGELSNCGNTILHDFGRVIGTDEFGNAATRLQVYISRGIIRAAFPV